MKTVTKVQPLDGYRLLVEFENGQQRISDLSHLLEKTGFFIFEKSHLFFRSICGIWHDHMERCRRERSRYLPR